MIFFLIIFLFAGCKGNNDNRNVYGEYIFRDHTVDIFSIPPVHPATPPKYPWERQLECGLYPITEAHFQCRGNGSMVPKIILDDGKEKTRFYDCSGIDGHLLPCLDGKEHIYPILITVLNHIQKETKKQVIITSGHRCPQHNDFLDHSSENHASKHMIGASVDFYVAGLEDNPNGIIECIMDYYRDEKEPQYRNFQRYTKKTNVRTEPWCNKELFIKVFQKDEGRNIDNDHLYPYINVQVRYDRKRQVPVEYTWAKAQRYFRK